MIAGIWATCSNTGNIIGLQAASYLPSNNNDKWENLMLYITIIYLIIATSIFFLFIGDPKEIGLEIKDDHIRAGAIEAQTDLA